MPAPARHLVVLVSAQRLELRESGRVLASYPVSTAANGLGCEPGSLRTPTGRFCIAEKIGAGAAPGMTFKDRLPTGEIGLGRPDADLVLTRILWLAGLDPENANTRERYIYIHGTNHEARLGEPASHGCIRMANADVAQLFDAVEVGTEVLIQES